METGAIDMTVVEMKSTLSQSADQSQALVHRTIKGESVSRQFISILFSECFHAFVVSAFHTKLGLINQVLCYVVSECSLLM